MSCDLALTYCDDRWATIISPDQLACDAWLQDHPEYTTGKTILHVGTGNSNLYTIVDSLCKSIDGITIMDSEIQVAEDLKAEGPSDSAPYKILKINKYNLEHTKDLPKYDLIVDINPSQHACCNEHWVSYFGCMLGKLTENGAFITHTQGFAPHTPRIHHISVAELERLAGGEFIVEVQPEKNPDGHSVVIIKRKGA